MKPGEIKNRIFGFLDSWFPNFLFLGCSPGCFLWDFKFYEEPIPQSGTGVAKAVETAGLAGTP
jgi:hypothetical protein